MGVILGIACVGFLAILISINSGADRQRYKDQEKIDALLKRIKELENDT